jgi:hypothetical protein
MSESTAAPAYPELSKSTTGGAWPVNTQAPYTQHSYPQPGVPVHYIVPIQTIDPSIAGIRDWLPWSIINLFIGWLLGGILPLVFSLICRSNKSSNNASGARTMSTLALIFNILVTLGGIGAWIALIVTLVFVGKVVNCTTYPYCR